MGVVNRFPFGLLAGIISAILLVLVCITAHHACYNQSGHYLYSGVRDDNYCYQQCEGNRAMKLIYYPNTIVDSITGLPVYRDLYTQSLYPGTTRRVMRCGWAKITNRVFFTAATLSVLWAMIELFLAAKRKLILPLTIIVIFCIVGMWIVTAIYQMRDIHSSSCSSTQSGIPNVLGHEQFRSCFRSIFIVSFILTIVAILLWAVQLIYILARRKKIKEREEVQYSNIPQQNVATEPVIAAPIVEKNVIVSENRIA